MHNRPALLNGRYNYDKIESVSSCRCHSSPIWIRTYKQIKLERLSEFSSPLELLNKQLSQSQLREPTL